MEVLMFPLHPLLPLHPLMLIIPSSYPSFFNAFLSVPSKSPILETQFSWQILGPALCTSSTPRYL